MQGCCHTAQACLTQSALACPAQRHTPPVLPGRTISIGRGGSCDGGQVGVGLVC